MILLSKRMIVKEEFQFKFFSSVALLNLDFHFKITWIVSETRYWPKLAFYNLLWTN